jgi:predicted RNase H-like nuclease (RuvC/YqgF family)
MGRLSLKAIQEDIMGILILTIVAITICALINIYDAKQEVKSSRNAYRLLLKENEKLKKDKEFWKKQEQKRSDYYYEELEKKHKLVDSIKEYKETIWDLEEKNRDLKHKVWESDNEARETRFKVMDLEREIMNLERKIKTLESTNDQLMDKIINHLKTKEIITSNKITTTKIETPKIKANEIIKSVNNSTNWQIINKHGLSVNKMYKENPYYNPFEKDSLPLTKTNEYKVWIKETLRAMEKTNIKSLRSMNVNPNKPMKLEVEFKLVRGSDTDNPLKSFIDLLVRYYGLTDDNNFVDIHISRNSVWAKDYSDGQIKFKISNI